MLLTLRFLSKIDRTGWKRKKERRKERKEKKRRKKKDSIQYRKTRSRGSDRGIGTTLLVSSFEFQDSRGSL